MNQAIDQQQVTAQRAIEKFARADVESETLQHLQAGLPSLMEYLARLDKRVLELERQVSGG